MNDSISLPLVIHVAYLVASILFILGLKRLSSPATARSGNQLAAIGMVIAVGATLATPGLAHRPLIFVALTVGCVVGAVAARRVAMTDMPQMVALLNGLGGGAAAVVSIAEFWRAAHTGEPLSGLESGSVLFGVVAGGISFSGSLVAFGKLQGIVTEKALAGVQIRIVNAILLAVTLAAAVWTGVRGELPAFTVAVVGSLAVGIAWVMAIGGADMPVVISLLNSCTGLAAAATGFVLGNNALIISGTLVGASGTLLTMLMCASMNRSLGNVLLAGVGSGEVASTSAGPVGGQVVHEISADDAAILLASIQSLIIVPGYGLAVAQAQHVVRELADLLTAKGVDVKFAVHPVAGRMPGHMNVLLAEANVPYDQLYDIEQINGSFPHTDVALVIGANDVVNPAARTDKGSPIYGMPILDADKAAHVIVIKRSLKPGFAGVDNALYSDPKTYMLFGDAKAAVAKLVDAVKRG